MACTHPTHTTVCSTLCSLLSLYTTSSGRCVGKVKCSTTAACWTEPAACGTKGLLGARLGGHGQ